MRSALFIALFLLLGCQHEKPPSSSPRGDSSVSFPENPPTLREPLRDPLGLPEGEGSVGEWDSPYARTALRVGGDVKPPTVLREEPVDLSACGRLEGWPLPIVEVVVETNGQVLDARLVKAVVPCMREPVLESVRAWRFRPATLHDEPVRSICTVSVIIRPIKH